MGETLLLCPEPLGHRHPAGVGIRFLEMARVLREAGHAVTLLTPDGADVDGATGGHTNPENIRKWTARSRVAVVQGHIANDLFAYGTALPTVVDLYDPFIVENLHYGRTDRQIYAHDHATLIRSLSAGDFFLCASEYQRLFYLGLLLACGRVNPSAFGADSTLRSLIELAPFGVPSPRPRVQTDKNKSAVLFGGIYDWYQPMLAIEAARIARETLPELTLTFTHHPNAELTPQGVARETMAVIKDLNYESFVRFEPWVAYEERASYFDQFQIGLLTFRASLETDLAMRTRLFDFLWAGLPVVTSSAQGTDAVVERYRAGRVIRSSAAEDYATAIVELCTDRSTRETAIEGGRQFSREHQWTGVLSPLLNFCNNPRIDPHKPVSFSSSPQSPVAKRSLLEKIRRRAGIMS